DFEFGTGATGDDADSATGIWSTWEHNRRVTKKLLQTFGQALARDICLCLETDVLAMIEKEGLRLFQAKSGAELDVVPELAMEVQRQMGAIDSQVVIQERMKQLITLPRPGVSRSPKKAVMHEKEIGFGFDGKP